MQEKSRFHSYNILCVISACGGGDWPPLLALAQGLHLKGHQVVVVCDTSTLRSVHAAKLVPLCLPAGQELGNVFDPATTRLFPDEEEVWEDIENPLKDWAQSCANFIIRSLEEWRPAMVITSLFGLGLGERLANEFSALRCFLNPSYYFQHPGEEFRRSDFSELGGRMYRHWLLPLANSADMVLHATDPTFDCGSENLPRNHTYVGPMFWEEPGERWNRVDEPGPPWVLISLSTSPQIGDLVIVAAAMRALKLFKLRVLVTLAPGHDLDELGDIPANVHIHRYIPHSHILPQCVLVISHAGHGIVMKAMVHGIPMVLVPWGRDQPGVANRAKRLEVATVVPKSKCNSEVLRRAISRVLDESQFKKKSLKLAERLCNSNSLERAVDRVEWHLNITR